MKKLLSILIFILLFNSNAIAFNFKEDIDKYGSKNEGVVSSIYILNRCSGLLQYVAAMTINAEGKKNTVEKYIDFSLITIHAATRLHSNLHSVSYTKAREILLAKRTKLINFYKEDAEKLILMNGRFLSGHILKDTKTCLLLAQFAKNNN